MSNIVSFGEFGHKRSLIEDRKRVTRLLKKIGNHNKFVLLSEMLLPFFDDEDEDRHSEGIIEFVDRSSPFIDFSATYSKEFMVSSFNFYCTGEPYFCLKEVEETITPYFSIMYHVNYDGEFEEMNKIMAENDFEHYDMVMDKIQSKMETFDIPDAEEDCLFNAFFIYPSIMITELLGDGWFIHVEEDIVLHKEDGYIDITFYRYDEVVCLRFFPELLNQCIQKYENENRGEVK